jgi:hypothetical protein
MKLIDALSSPTSLVRTRTFQVLREMKHADFDIDAAVSVWDSAPKNMPLSELILLTTATLLRLPTKTLIASGLDWAFYFIAGRSLPGSASQWMGEVVASMQRTRPVLVPDFESGVPLNAMQRENQELRDRCAVLQRERDAAGANAEIARKRASVLQGFKDYVHQRLDRADVPYDPKPAENMMHGCRVEGRLDWVFAHMEGPLVEDAERRLSATWDKLQAEERKNAELAREVDRLRAELVRSESRLAKATDAESYKAVVLEAQAAYASSTSAGDMLAYILGVVGNARAPSNDPVEQHRRTDLPLNPSPQIPVSSLPPGIHTNPDAQVWAQAFVKFVQTRPDLPTDEGYMLGWFANAMMAMHDFLANQRQKAEAAPGIGEGA